MPSAIDIIIAELVKLRQDVDALKHSKKVKKVRAEEPIPFGSSNQTTRAQRDALHLHIEKLDNAIKNKKEKKIEKQNTFIVNQIVEQYNNANRTRGRILFIACQDALPSVRKCDKEKCEHKNPKFVWVQWKDKLIAHYFETLRLMSKDELKPHIGRELSGKIGPWTYSVETKRWKKDGNDKEYTNEEFEDIMFYETHPYEKDVAINFMKFMKRK